MDPRTRWKRPAHGVVQPLPRGRAVRWVTRPLHSQPRGKNRRRMHGGKCTSQISRAHDGLETQRPAHHTCGKCKARLRCRRRTERSRRLWPRHRREQRTGCPAARRRADLKKSVARGRCCQVMRASVLLSVGCERFLSVEGATVLLTTCAHRQACYRGGRTGAALPPAAVDEHWVRAAP
jgi:hypothetical protein